MDVLRRWVAAALGAAVICRAAAARADDAAAASAALSPPRIVFVTGDDEYGSEISMPMIADILSRRHGMTATVLFAENDRGERDRHGHRIPGLEKLQTADAAVFFMRFRALPDDQLNELLSYAKSAKPMIGLRTSTHALQYPGPPNDQWNEAFGRDTWGQKWIDHYGHGNSSLIDAAPGAAASPLLRGVQTPFWAHSWLYIMNRGDDRLPDDCRHLLVGDSIRGASPGGEKFGERQPVAWTRELPAEGGGAKRIFYASLGHPKDFENPSVRRLVVSAVYWALGRESEIPAAGPNVELVSAYEPGDPH